jgi:hypothetical protein
MTTRHIDDQTWRKVEEKTMEAIFELKTPVKQTEMLKWLILKGLEEITEDDYHRFGKNKKKTVKSTK